MSVFRGKRKPGKKWLRSDTLLAQALDLYEDSLCPDCGQPRDEALDELHDVDNPSRTHIYKVSDPLRDHACTALSVARERIAEAKFKHPEALRFGLSKVPVVRAVPIE